MGFKPTKNISFGYVDKNFINLYSDENPPLTSGDFCYFLFTNIVDIHKPLIAKGYIRNDVFTDGLNKIYQIELISVEESHHTIQKYLSRPTKLWCNVKTQKVHILTNIDDKQADKFYKSNLFRIEAFFVRNNIEAIKQLRTEYVEIIRQDLQRQLDEIDNNN